MHFSYSSENQDITHDQYLQKLAKYRDYIDYRVLLTVNPNWDGYKPDEQERPAVDPRFLSSDGKCMLSEPASPNDTKLVATLKELMREIQHLEKRLSERTGNSNTNKR